MGMIEPGWNHSVTCETLWAQTVCQDLYRISSLDAIDSPMSQVSLRSFYRWVNWRSRTPGYPRAESRFEFMAVCLQSRYYQHCFLFCWRDQTPREKSQFKHNWRWRDRRKCWEGASNIGRERKSQFSSTDVPQVMRYSWANFPLHKWFLKALATI